MTSVWYDDDYAKAITQNFLVLRTGLTNGAHEVLAAAGFERTPIPDLDKPPGGMEQLYWEAIWFETLATDAALFAAKNPSPAIAQAAKILANLERVTFALNAAGRQPMPLVEAAICMSIATMHHIQANGRMPEPTTPDPELAARAERLRRGPEKKRELAAIWRDPLRRFLEGLRETEPATLRLDAPILWALWEERNPKKVERLKNCRLFNWPKDDTARKAVRGIVAELTAD